MVNIRDINNSLTFDTDGYTHTKCNNILMKCVNVACHQEYTALSRNFQICMPIEIVLYNA